MVLYAGIGEPKTTSTLRGEKVVGRGTGWEGRDFTYCGDELGTVFLERFGGGVR